MVAWRQRRDKKCSSGRQCHCSANKIEMNIIETHVRFGLNVHLALGALEFLHGLTGFGVDDLEGELTAFHDDGGWLGEKGNRFDVLDPPWRGCVW